MSRSAVAPPTGAAIRSELVPLADRLVVLQGVRLAMAAVVVLTSLLVPRTAGTLGVGVTLATVAYVGITLAVEAARRWARVRALSLLNLVLLADGVWLALVLSRSGGARSVLGFLLYVHVVAVTLLVSYRTGLKVTAWHSLLLFVSYFAAAGGVTGADDGLREGVVLDPDRATVHALGLWLVAIGTAMFSSLSERELRRGKAELRAHAELATELEEARDADAVASLLLAHAVQFFGFLRGAVVLRRDDGFEARVRELGSDVEVFVHSNGRVDRVVERCWRERTPVLVRALGDEDALLDGALPFGVNVVVVPMVAGGVTVGALVLERGGGPHTRIRGRVVAAVAKLAAHAALALRNAALLDQVGRMAHTDALTGLANRRVFEQALSREVARSQRTGEPVTLVLLDIDHFKTVNDTFGHQVGDDVLRDVAHAVAEASRDTDLVARWGGEELAVLLPACAPREGFRVAQRLRAAVAEAALHVPVTISAGVAGVPVNATTADDLLRAADTALYAAKKSGRDRTARARESGHARRGGPRRRHPRPAPARAARRPA
ncbi:MAG TPA: GGDEF domain-containing protein [Acidimicrobiales bacterium]|nr:GGDEF domain-containing protein [Acidimicrobiales bacterium]